MDDLNEKAARRRKIAHAIEIVILIVLFICFIFPFILVIINVFKTKADITSNPLALIGEHGFTIKNFPEAMRKMNFLRSFGNSALITIVSTIFTILIASMTAFVIVRNKWKACGALFGLMIASMVIPFQVLMIPLVSLYGGVLGMLNHRATLIFMHVGFSLSMATFMFHGAIFTNVPLALEEAATIDGASPWQRFSRVTIPLLMPAIRINVVTNIIGSLSVFDIIMSLTEGGPGYSTESLSIYIMRMCYGSRTGYSTAVALILFFIILIPVLISMYLTREKE